MLEKIDYQKVLEYFNEQEVSNNQIIMYQDSFDLAFEKRNIYQVRYNKMRGVILIIWTTEAFKVPYVTQIVDSFSEVGIPQNWFQYIIQTEFNNFRLFEGLNGI